MPSFGLVLHVALVATVAPLAASQGARPGAPAGKPFPGKGSPKGKGKPQWTPGITRNNSKVCKVMWRLWRTARRLLGDHPTSFTDKDCENLHEFYNGPHFHPQVAAYGYKVPTDCIGYVGIYKSGSTETLCNMRNKFGKRKRWAQGMGMNMMQKFIQIHMFPIVNESEGAVVDPNSKYFEDNPQDLARAEQEGRPRHGTGFTWVRDPAKRFVSGYSEIEYYMTIGEPYFFMDIVLHSPKARQEYVPGTMANNAKKSCTGCNFWEADVNSTERARRFVLDVLKLGFRPEFLLRHIYPQVAQANTFSRSAGPLDFVCQLESFERGWEFVGMLTNATMDLFNRSCRGHNYSDSGAGFGPRETMYRNIFGTEEGSSGTCAADGADSEACKEEAGAGVSVIAKSLGCALLLPDYVCFGYKNIVAPEVCVAAGFASSVEEWGKFERYIRREMCPRVRRWIGGLHDSGPLDTSSVRELFNEKRAAGM